MNDEIEEIYREHSTSVLNYLISITKDKDLSEDLMQETFYRATKYINTFKGDSKILTWLCQIAKNLWYDEVKDRKKFKYVTLEEEVISDFDMKEQITREEDKRRLYKQLDVLPPKIKELMYLKITTKSTFKQIGDILGEKEVWARVTFYRTKEKLKEMNREEDEEYETK